MIAALSAPNPATDSGRMTLDEARGLIEASAVLHERLMASGYSAKSANAHDPMITAALVTVFNAIAARHAPPHFFVLDKLDDITSEEIEHRIVEVLCEEFAVQICAALVRDGFQIDPKFAEPPASRTATA